MSPVDGLGHQPWDVWIASGLPDGGEITLRSEADLGAVLDRAQRLVRETSIGRMFTFARNPEPLITVGMDVDDGHGWMILWDDVRDGWFSGGFDREGEVEMLMDRLSFEYQPIGFFIEPDVARRAVLDIYRTGQLPGCFVWKRFDD